MNVVAFGIYKYVLELTVADLEGFLWFLQKPPFETLQDKFTLKLYKPTNLYTAIE